MKFRKKPVWIALISTFGLLAMPLFQNCSSGSFNSSLSSPSVNGSGANNGPDSSGTQPQPGGGPPALPPPVALGGTLTDLKIENTSGTEQDNVPVTFGQTFPQGALLSSETLAGKLSDNSLLALQVETKATHSDGSVRHAVISAVLPKLLAGQTETLSLIKAAQNSNSQQPLTPQDMMAAGFGATVNINLGGVAYSASPDQALRGSSYKTWLSGPLVNEWLVAVPLKTSSGTAHPHLMARFDIRSYTGLNRAKVDVIIENNWAYEPGPQDLLYDVQINLGGQTVYSKTGLNHYHHSRWKKTFWWGAEPAVHLRHNSAYLMLSRAVPNYDPTVVISETSLASLDSRWTGTRIEPMGPGLAEPYMPTTGGRADIGLLPGWVVNYLLSQDKRAKKVTLGTADLAGSWPMHYRDQNTDQPLSVINFPYSSILANPGDMINPATGKSEAFPACGGTCSYTNNPDSSHEPNLAYLPYLVTGDHYYLEELQFWAMYNIFHYNPYYREFAKGWVKSDQLRGQAWSLRTLAEAAAFTPDNDPLKTHFNSFLDNNLDWYNTNFTNNPNASPLGFLSGSTAMVYNNNVGLAPWQDDFFTQAVGHTLELGFAKASPLLKWKTQFPIARMTDPGFCWIVGAAYSMNVRDTETSPLFTTMAQIYQASFPSAETSLTCASSAMATYLNLKVGEMTGYSDSDTGMPSDMQPALAYSATSGAANGPNAWQVFINRSVKPDYSSSPQFAIVPRQ